MPNNQAAASIGDRFEAPKACVTTKHDGVQCYGLMDKATRRPLQSSFEEAKAAQNVEHAEAMSARPGGRRFESRNAQESAAKLRAQTQDLLNVPTRPSSKEHVTSNDNPLGPRYAETCTSPMPPSHQGKRVYEREGGVPALVDCLASSMVPQSMAQLAASHAAAAAKAKHAAVRWASGVNDVPNAEQQEQEGEDGFDEEVVDVTLNPRDQLDIATDNRQQRLAVAANLILQQQDLEEALLKEYPHGVPKRVLQQLRAAGETGLQLPSLGYGFPTCLSDKMAAASLR